MNLSASSRSGALTADKCLVETIVANATNRVVNPGGFRESLGSGEGESGSRPYGDDPSRKASTVSKYNVD
jgi:hypothetical protein